MGQKTDGSTLNATISTNAAGATTFTFNDPFSMNIALGASSGVNVKGGAFNNRFLLDSSSGDTITGGVGNDIFVVAASASDLGGNVLKGAGGVDIVQLKGSFAEIDLTGVSAGTAASSGIEAVVGGKALSGEIVDLNMADLASSTLNFGGAGPGNAFVAMIGRDGVVNLTTPGAVKFLGAVDASGAGFAADGTPLDPTATAALAAEVTPIGDVLGSLAQMYNNSTNPKGWAAEAGNLSAYVFSSGVKLYTVWTDGTVNQVGSSTGVSTPLFQPLPTVSSNPQLGQISLYDPTTAGSVTLTTTAAGATSLSLTKDAPGATGAIVVSGGATGLAIHGDNGANGGDWYNLAKSGGANVIYGTVSDDLFELGGSTALSDTLKGQGGFDIVHAPTDGTDVDLTGLSMGIPASSGIEAVVGSASGTQTVELNLSSLAIVLDGTGAKTSVFEAMLGSSTDTLTLSGNGKWQQIATISPGGNLPTGATALTDASALDAAFNGHATSGKAEATLVGNLFEQLGSGGVVTRYVTIWTDATIVSPFPSAVTSMVQAMAGQSSGSSTDGVTTTSNSTPSPVSPLSLPGAA
jgi:hypothetical protein